MSIQPQYDADYPYAARYGAARAAAIETLPGWWQSLKLALRRWLRRLAVAAAVLGLLMLVAAGVIAYRLIAQATYVAELRAHGCEVTFLHQLPGETDPLPGPVRSLVGDEVCSEIAGVTFGDGRFNFYWQYRENDVWAICRECAKLDKLRTFSMTSDAFTFDLVSSWPQLDQLEELEINSSQLTDANLDRISQMPRLKHVKLSSPSVTSKGVRLLARLPHLETLELARIHGRIFDRSQAAEPMPGGFPALTRLVIDQAEIDDEMILSLGPLPELREAVLSQAQITDSGLAHLLSGGNVESIVLNDPQDDFEQMAAVRCPQPRSFHLLGTPISGAGLAAFAGQEVTGLVLDKTALTDDGLRTIGQVTGLRYLSCRDTKVTGAGVSHLAGLRTLAKLDLAGCRLSRAGLEALAKMRLFQLDLSRTPLTNDDLLMFETCDTITHLVISETKATPGGIKTLYEARKRRLGTAGRQEMLILMSDAPELTEAYVAPSRLRESSQDPFEQPGANF